jgi:hypothetical protein
MPWNKLHWHFHAWPNSYHNWCGPTESLERVLQDSPINQQVICQTSNWWETTTTFRKTQQTCKVFKKIASHASHSWFVSKHLSIESNSGDLFAHICLLFFILSQRTLFQPAVRGVAWCLQHGKESFNLVDKKLLMHFFNVCQFFVKIFST